MSVEEMKAVRLANELENIARALRVGRLEIWEAAHAAQQAAKRADDADAVDFDTRDTPLRMPCAGEVAP